MKPIKSNPTVYSVSEQVPSGHYMEKAHWEIIEEVFCMAWDANTFQPITREDFLADQELNLKVTGIAKLLLLILPEPRFNLTFRISIDHRVYFVCVGIHGNLPILSKEKKVRLDLPLT